jgi:2-phospho-L-lactate guanylyltransferase
MPLVAVVPVKALSHAKSRLAPLLSASQRSDLTVALLDRTLTALRGSGVIARVALATPEKGLAARWRVESVNDGDDLNDSLAAGARWAIECRASRLLIVPADLPLIQAEDVRHLVEMPHSNPSILIARTQDGGTGALLLTPPAIMAPSFGPSSFQRHLTAADRRGTPVVAVPIEAFRFDLDTVRDFEAVRSRLPSYFC